jgi:hypothetical protein
MVNPTANIHGSPQSTNYERKVPIMDGKEGELELDHCQVIVKLIHEHERLD